MQNKKPAVKEREHASSVNKESVLSKSPDLSSRWRNCHFTPKQSCSNHQSVKSILILTPSQAVSLDTKTVALIDGCYIPYSINLIFTCMRRIKENETEKNTEGSAWIENRLRIL